MDVRNNTLTLEKDDAESLAFKLKNSDRSKFSLKIEKIFKRAIDIVRRNLWCDINNSNYNSNMDS